MIQRGAHGTVIQYKNDKLKMCVAVKIEEESSHPDYQLNNKDIKQCGQIQSRNIGCDTVSKYYYSMMPLVKGDMWFTITRGIIL